MMFTSHAFKVTLTELCLFFFVFPVNTYKGDELISFNQFSVFVIGAGGFGGSRTSEKAKV